MRYLITGGCGFIGSNLAEQVLTQGDELFVFDNLFRFGSDQNLRRLHSKGQFKFYHSDIRSANDVEFVIMDTKPDVIFHLAGQVAMTTSVENPRLDFETNAIGTVNLLEAVRKFSPDSIIIYSSTNKVYGDLEYLTFKETETRYECVEYPNGYDEGLKLNFTTPYGCSKGSADQYLIDYYKMYGIKTVVFRHSSMYGGYQNATFDQGWVGWFIQKAIEIKNKQNSLSFSISGNGKQVRDVLHSTDVINLYFKATNSIDKIKGQVFNIGGGIVNSLSLLELFQILEKKFEIIMDYHQLPFRSSDQLVFVADYSKATKLFDWQPKVTPEQGITSIIDASCISKV